MIIIQTASSSFVIPDKRAKRRADLGSRYSIHKGLPTFICCQALSITDKNRNFAHLDSRLRGNDKKTKEAQL
jgi:hypothetical protein